MTLIKDRMITLPNVIDMNTLRNAYLASKNAENILSAVAEHRRMQRWKEQVYDWLRHLGYGFLGLIIFFILYKIDVLSALIDVLMKIVLNCYTNCSFGNRAETMIDRNPYRRLI